MRDTVLAAARKLGLEVRVANTPVPARNVEAAAKAVGAEPSQIATARVFVADGDPVVTLAPGNAAVDLDGLCGLLDCADIRPASAEEVRAATGFPVSAVCPIGHDVPLWFDRGLLAHERIWLLAGDQSSLFEVTSSELADRCGATVADITVPPAGADSLGPASARAT